MFKTWTGTKLVNFDKCIMKKENNVFFYFVFLEVTQQWFSGSGPTSHSMHWWTTPIEMQQLTFLKSKNLYKFIYRCSLKLFVYRIIMKLIISNENYMS